MPLVCFCSDTFKANVVSLRGHKYIQLFANRHNFNKSYPIKSKGNAHHSLDLFIHDVGPLTTNETVTSVAGVMEIESP